MMPFRPLRMRNPGLPAGTFIVGNNLFANDATISANTNTGSAFQSSVSGTANSIVIKGHSATGNTAHFYLCVYGATSESSWGGSLLAQTAIQSPLGVGELRSVALLLPLSIVAGSWYALTVLPDITMNHAAQTGLGISDRGFSDTYADGPAATAGTLALNGFQTAAIYLTA